MYRVSLWSYVWMSLEFFLAFCSMVAGFNYKIIVEIWLNLYKDHWWLIGGEMLAKLSLDYYWPGYIREDYQTWKLTTTITTTGVSYLKPAPGIYINVSWADIAYYCYYNGWIFPASIEYSIWCLKRWCNCSTCLNEPVVLVIEYLSDQLFRVFWKWTINWNYFHIYAVCNVYLSSPHFPIPSPLILQPYISVCLVLWVSCGLNGKCALSVQGLWRVAFAGYHVICVQ